MCVILFLFKNRGRVLGGGGRGGVICQQCEEYRDRARIGTATTEENHFGSKLFVLWLNISTKPKNRTSPRCVGKSPKTATKTAKTDEQGTKTITWLKEIKDRASGTKPPPPPSMENQFTKSKKPNLIALMLLWFYIFFGQLCRQF